MREDFLTTGLEINAFEKFYLKLTGWNLENEKEVINETKIPEVEKVQVVEKEQEVIVKLPKTGM